MSSLGHGLPTVAGPLLAANVTGAARSRAAGLLCGGRVPETGPITHASLRQHAETYLTPIGATTMVLCHPRNAATAHPQLPGRVGHGVRLQLHAVHVPARRVVAVRLRPQVQHPGGGRQQPAGRIQIVCAS